MTRQFSTEQIVDWSMVGGAALVFVIVMGLMIFAPGVVFGHGAADWIQRGAYKNAIGELCCGEKDCVELDKDDVKPVDGGYLIKSLNEFVPQSETLPFSPGGFWRCAWGGHRKCFFITPSGS